MRAASGLPFRRAAVVGLGRSGAAAARLLAAAGIEVRVTESGDSPASPRGRQLATLGIATELGGHSAGIAAWAEALVVSPGVPPANSVITAALERGIPVWSEIELAWRFARVPVLAVTGTNGKTTTTTLLAALLQAGGLDAVAAGNIGYPMVDAVTGPHDVIVCEVSSFQLAFGDLPAPRSPWSSTSRTTTTTGTTATTTTSRPRPGSPGRRLPKTSSSPDRPTGGH